MLTMRATRAHRWAVSFAGTDSTRAVFGKLLFGGIKGSSTLGELVQQYEGLYGRRGPGLIASAVGKPVATASHETVNTWAATAELITPLAANVRATNGAITVTASLNGASLTAFTSPSFNAAATSNLQSELASRLGALLAGRIPSICPDISIVGALATNESAPEPLPVYVRVRVVGAPSATALAVFVAHNNSATLPLANTDLTAGADCAYLARESVFQKTLEFCFRTDRFPKHWRTEIISHLTANGSVNVETTLDIESAAMSLEQFNSNSARQEDRADLLIVVRSRVADVRNPDGTPATSELRAQVSADATFNYTIDLYFSNVGTPSMNPDPQLDGWFQQWRGQVSRRLSVPFVAVANAMLLERALNGVEKVMLSRQTLVFY